MKFSILTLFPEYFSGVLSSSLIGKAISSKIIQVDLVQLRDFSDSPHRVVDDRPFGGGNGMVLMPGIVEKAMSSLLKEHALSLEDLEKNVSHYKNTKELDPLFPMHGVYLSPQGTLWTSALAANFGSSLKAKHLVLLCGHYEGVDQRPLDLFFHRELSIGDYILTGGEPAAAVILDSISRFIPGVVGDPQSVFGDTFGASLEMSPGGLKGPVYTRPQEWRGSVVPEVLLSGNHQNIQKWRLEQSLKTTKNRRPELLKDSNKKGGA